MRVLMIAGVAGVALVLVLRGEMSWQLIAIVVSAVSPAVAVLSFRKHSNATDPRALAVRARRLLLSVSTAEAQVLAKLLGDSGAAAPADLVFGQTELAVARRRTDGGRPGGSLATIADYYRELGRGRLVILGDAGAGKSVLALKLLLDLSAAARERTEHDPEARIRVPVRLNLSGFSHPDEASPAKVKDHFDSYLAGHLTKAHGLPRRVARTLVDDGWVLPVIDGFDELDSAGHSPDRARRVLDALNQPTGPSPAPVVLTCRTDRYHQLAEETPLLNATTVAVRALEVAQVIDWLRHHFPDDSQPDGVERRWRSVVRRISDRPGGRLATHLRSPLMLYLAVTVYRDSASTPREMCDMDTTALRDHLLDRLVPAVTEHDRRYAADDVRRWLHTIAGYLAAASARGDSGTDFYPHQLWRGTGAPNRPGLGVHLVATVMAVSTMAPLLVGVADDFDQLPTADGRVSVFFAVLLPVLVAAAAAAFPSKRVPYGLGLRPVRGSSLRQLPILGAISVIVLLVLEGLVGIIEEGFPEGIRSGLASGLSAAPALVGASLTAVVIFGTVRPLEVAMRPSTPMRMALYCDLYLITMVTVGMAATFWPVRTLNFAIVTLSVGLWIVVTISSWPYYGLALLSYARRGELPLRLGRFLDWAHAAGLLRLSGTAVQFRHQELQAHVMRRVSSGRPSPVIPKPTA